MFTLANAPQGIGRNLDNGFRLFFAGIGPVAVLLVVMIIIDALLFVFLGTQFYVMMSQIEHGQTPMAAGLGQISLFLFLFSLIYLLFNNAMIAKYGAIAYEQGMSIGAAIATGARKILPVFVYGIIYMIIIAVSSIPLAILMAVLQPHGVLALIIIIIGILPPMILGLSLYLGPYLIIIDNRGIFESIGASHKLVWGNWWRTALYFTIILIIMIAIMFAIQFTFGLIIGLIVHAGPGNGGLSFMIVLQVINQLVSLVFMPVLIALFIPYFHDLKLRKEGGDLASRINAA